ncbi:hypothetical protein DH2020_044507 [Rehmannia glutinosa]|uniref:Uncharacterized protein n=1 Tax=Rehmannia glutinosa TaxID=99300 RepID=A0ABR0UGQ4_REHGL
MGIKMYLKALDQMSVDPVSSRYDSVSVGTTKNMVGMDDQIKQLKGRVLGGWNMLGIISIVRMAYYLDCQNGWDCVTTDVVASVPTDVETPAAAPVNTPVETDLNRIDHENKQNQVLDDHVTDRTADMQPSGIEEKSPNYSSDR